MGFLGLDLDLEKQLVFYGSYHAHPINQLVHIVFVPLIWLVLQHIVTQVSDFLAHFVLIVVVVVCYVIIGGRQLSGSRTRLALVIVGQTLRSSRTPATQSTLLRSTLS